MSAQPLMREKGGSRGTARTTPQVRAAVLATVEAQTVWARSTAGEREKAGSKLPAFVVSL
jgi:hypothetical protein